MQFITKLVEKKEKSVTTCSNSDESNFEIISILQFRTLHQERRIRTKGPIQKLE